MKNGKICFIHFRNTENGVDQPLSKGGATVAWRINPDSGDIEIGAPAVCSPADNYVKSVGRDIALLNLVGNKSQGVEAKPLAVSVPKAEYVDSMSKELDYNLSAPVLTPELIYALKATAFGFLEDGIFSVANSTWFESQVRHRVVFHENRVHTVNQKSYGSNASR